MFEEKLFHQRKLLYNWTWQKKKITKHEYFILINNTSHYSQECFNLKIKLGTVI